jgi:hypothetical protein
MFLIINTRYQTKTPLQFGKYVGAYIGMWAKLLVALCFKWRSDAAVFIDDGLNDPIFLEIAKSLQHAMPRIMKGHDLRYLWAYKYDSEWSSGINLHADQAGE